jgi:hypothetical protein
MAYKRFTPDQHDRLEFSGAAGASGGLQWLRCISYAAMTSKTLRPLQEAIHPDVRNVYLKGLDPNVDALAFSALTVLAETTSGATYDGGSRYYSDLIKQLLLSVIVTSQPSLSTILDVGPGQLVEGMKELFGLGEYPIIGKVGQRQENASTLFGYKNAGSLRHGRRGDKRTITWILEEICHQLALLADRHGLTPDELGGGQIIVPPLEGIVATNTLDGEYALKIVQLSRALFYELHIVRSSGTATPIAKIPNLLKIASRALHTRHDEFTASMGDLEHVLLWAIAQFDDDRHRQGTRYLFGLGDTADVDDAARYERAGRCFGYESSTRFMEGSKEAWAITFVRDQLILLAGHMDFWPVEEDPGTLF